MIWNFVILIFIFLISLAQYLLDYVLIDKKALRYKLTRIFLLVVMVVGIGGSALLQYSEERKKGKLTEEISILRFQNDSLIALINLTHSEVLLLQNRVQDFNSKLDPFIQIATSKYPHLSFEKALEMLSREITEVKEIAKPNTISYSRGDIKKTEKGYDVFVWCKLSKDQPIGALSFTINLPPKSNVDILDISPAGMAMDVRVEISENKKAAMLSFLPATTGHPGITISLSDKEDFKIEGNKGFGVQNIQIK